MDQLHYPQRVGKDNANPIIRLTVEVGGKLKIIRGRDAWTLSELISSGSLGVTPIEPASLGDDSDAVKISAARYSGNCAAGVAGSAHGVRKIAATRAAENGATVAQLEAIFGWKGGRMASLYTESADRRRLAIEAMGELANLERTSMDAPLYKVGPPGRKSK